MSISRQNLSIVIVTFKSEDVIHQCIQSIDSEIDIIVVENSDNEKFQKELEEKYSNVKCYISKKNLGKSDISNFVTHIKKLDIFYPAEDYHQDYYKNNPIRYKLYKTGCGRVQKLKKIWD